MDKRHYAFTFLLCLGIGRATLAQDTTTVFDQQIRKLRGNFHVGVTTGLNNTWIKVDNGEQHNQHYQYQKTFKTAPVGVLAGYKFNDRHDVLVEAYLSNQGQQYNLTDDGGNTVGKKSINLTYLQIPLLFKFTSGNATRFNLFFGPQAGFLIKGEEINYFDKTTTATIAGGSTKTIPAGTYTLAKKEKSHSLTHHAGGLHAIDPTLALGFGLEKDVTDKLYLSANLRFNYGFRDIRDTEHTRDTYDFDHYILRYNIFGGLQVGLHYNFVKF